MKIGSLIGIALLAGAVSAVLLPQMAELEAAQHREAGGLETTFAGRMNLNDDNLVDVLAALPLTLPVDSAAWNGRVLSLDLKVTGNDHEPRELYGNMAEAITFAFQETGNVGQLLLRVIAEDKWLGSRRLLLAGDIRRGEWSSRLTEELRQAGNHPLPDTLKTGLRISESELWNQQFIHP
ncbi:hypothetical protein [Paenibacillus tengchongensis]|uniref:hypothetical protein n=1 Tax=Paenibacillus tengchongensis TaxID=2608684 RepID=UPI00124BF9EC|nr:hypothetical protein [Paenibacillus tengchongensis]